MYGLSRSDTRDQIRIVLTSYHVHTTRSDGEAAGSEFVDAAIEAGLDELGISDHYTLLPAGRSAAWSMAPDELSSYCAEVLELRDKARGKLVVRCGLEADFDAETSDDLRELLSMTPVDYVIGSVHFVDGFPIDETKQEWDAITQAERNDIVLGYLDRMTQMARSNLFDIVGHFDLYKKFGYLPTVDVSPQIAAALDAIAAAGMPVEINTAGLYKDVCEIYPSETILRECVKRSIPAIITSDAHHPEHLTRGYSEAGALARRVKCARVVGYENRRQVFL